MKKKRTLNEYRQNKDFGYTSPVPKQESTVNSDMDVVQEILKEVYSEGFLTEVVFFALKAMKNNPSLTEIEALNVGREEWDL